jgi:hypothetical protein
MTQKELNQKVLISQRFCRSAQRPVAEAPSGSCTSSDSAATAPAATYASGTPSPAARKILDEKYTNYLG